ncbi:MAG: pyridoxamine 5'-phosphate oxidase [Anaerolineaceae bacterium]|nr:MAG: pyridoxamine 5'-phosphate oxidase [Anaerolineaceae bacterium]
MMGNVGNLRNKFKEASLNREDLRPDPIDQFAFWFRQAQEADLPYAHAMSLATASASGEVTSRIVLLRYFDEKGFVFFSGFDTKKSVQIAQNPQVALIFPWLILERQVKILGTAVKTPAKESLRFFATRSKESQIGAWLSQSSGVVSSKAILRARLEEFKLKFREGQAMLPELWGGYRVIANRIEFWQGRPSGLHDRFVYSKVGDSTWQIQRLAP